MMRRVRARSPAIRSSTLWGSHGEDSHLLPLVVVQRIRAAFDGFMVGLSENSHALQLTDNVLWIVALERPGIEPVAAIAVDQPSGFFLVISAIGRSGETEQKRLVRPLPAGQSDLPHDGGKARSNRPVRFVENNELEVSQKLVLVELIREFGVQRLNRRDDNMGTARRLRLVLRRLRLVLPSPTSGR